MEKKHIKLYFRGAGGREIFPIFEVGRLFAEENGSEQTSEEGFRSDNIPLAQTLEASYSKMKSLTNTVANTLSHSDGKDGSENLIQLNDDGGSQVNRIYSSEGISPTVPTASGGRHIPKIVQPVLTPDRLNKRQNGRRMKEDGEDMFTLTGQDIHGVSIVNCLDRDGYLRTGARPRDENGKPQLLPIGYRRIRRLTCIECERLQAFPDRFTEKGIDKNREEIMISDTQRYKCLGNAVTTNVVTFLGKRLLSRF